MEDGDIVFSSVPEPGRLYVTYFDEVKALPENGQNWYLVGGIAVPMDEIGQIENQVNQLAEDVFGSRELVPETEFHASYIYFGKGPFKGMKPVERIGILERLAAILASNVSIRRVYAAIDTTRLYTPDRAPSYAFAHFCERVQMMTARRSTTILIGDLDDQQAKSMVRDFSRFRISGTPWAFGISVDNVVDSVHFTRSHHSRMIQLADVYVFMRSARTGSAVPAGSPSTRRI